MNFSLAKRGNKVQAHARINYVQSRNYAVYVSTMGSGPVSCGGKESPFSLIVWSSRLASLCSCASFVCVLQPTHLPTILLSNILTYNLWTRPHFYSGHFNSGPNWLWRRTMGCNGASLPSMRCIPSPLHSAHLHIYDFNLYQLIFNDKRYIYNFT